MIYHLAERGGLVVQCGQGPAAFRRGRADFGRKRRRAV